MGKKSKIGRQRKDRFYHLAKETGYRSRAAFKLLQLNRKFEFLQNTRVLIDLCAAPGGWMQVAKQNMPVSSVVIGVDMYPMKPVAGCISLIEDITTDKCRVSLQKELKTWKVDVVLHDGAPNLGKNWLHDAYNQNCLTLSAFKLATLFLKEGGWFISKVFRSKDYNCLMWTFKQLFKKVHATKPPASRNESAEIFVICQYYLAPAKIDPRLLNPNYVFKELAVQSPVTIHTLLKSANSSKKSKSEGYPDDTAILHVKLPASEFIASDTPAVVLQNAYEIIIDNEEILKHRKTTNEIKKCCEDIKVLGKKELRDLLSWWRALRDEKKKSENEENDEKIKIDENCDTEDTNSLSDDEKELNEVSERIEEMIDEERRDAKRKKKKINKEKMKLLVKMNLNMRQKEDLGPTEEADIDMFQLSQITSEKQLLKITNQKPDTLVESDDENEPINKRKKIKYSTENSYLDDSGLYYRSEESESEKSEDEIDSNVEMLGLSDEKKELNDNKMKKTMKKVRFEEPENSEEAESEVEEAVYQHPLITDLDYRDVKDKRLSKANLWFDKDVFKDVELEEDEDYELDKMTDVIKSMGGEIIATKQNSTRNFTKDKPDSDNINGEPEKKNISTNKIRSDNCRSNSKRSKLNEEIKINEWDMDDADLITDKKRKKKERQTLNAEGLALGTLMVSSNKAKRDISDAGWNRYAFNDENLPEWFVEDEKKHFRKNIPVPGELVEEYTKSREELTVRPIKKIVEAKARKKKRAIRKMEKMKKKLEGVMDNPDMTAGEKAKQARQMYKKLKQRKPEVAYIVAKKHTAAKRVRRPKGLKGPYKVVDSRMKKDLRGKIRKETQNKSKKSVNKIKKSFKPKSKKK